MPSFQLEFRREVAGATRLELAASGVTGRRSNQLNYAPAQGEARTDIPPPQCFESYHTEQPFVAQCVIQPAGCWDPAWHDDYWAAGLHSCRGPIYANQGFCLQTAITSGVRQSLGGLQGWAIFGMALGDFLPAHRGPNRR